MSRSTIRSNLDAECRRRLLEALRSRTEPATARELYVAIDQNYWLCSVNLRHMGTSGTLIQSEVIRDGRRVKAYCLRPKQSGP